MEPKAAAAKGMAVKTRGPKPTNAPTKPPDQEEGGKIVSRKNNSRPVKQERDTPRLRPPKRLPPKWTHTRRPAHRIPLPFQHSRRIYHPPPPLWKQKRGGKKERPRRNHRRAHGLLNHPKTRRDSDDTSAKKLVFPTVRFQPQIRRTF